MNRTYGFQFFITLTTSVVLVPLRRVWQELFLQRWTGRRGPWGTRPAHRRQPRWSIYRPLGVEVTLSEWTRVGTGPNPTQTPPWDRVNRLERRPLLKRRGLYDFSVTSELWATPLWSWSERWTTLDFTCRGRIRGVVGLRYLVRIPPPQR